MAIENFIGGVTFQQFLLFIFAIVFTFVIGGILNVVIIRLLRDKVKPITYKTVSKVVMYGLYAFGLLYAFNNIIHFNVPASLAALGVLGVAILWPMLPVLQNIGSGIVLAFERPFKEEDIVEYNGKLCKVSSVMLRKTKLRALSGEVIYVPNLLFMTTTAITNHSSGEFIKVSFPVDITSSSDTEKAIELIKSVCAENPTVLPNVPERKINMLTRVFSIPSNFFKIEKNIKELKPYVTIKSITKEKTMLKVHFWIWDPALKEKIVSSLYVQLQKEFDKQSIQFG